MVIGLNIKIIINIIHYKFQKFGVSKILSFLWSSRLHLLDQIHNKNSNIVKYFYNKKCNIVYFNIF